MIELQGLKLTCLQSIHCACHRKLQPWLEVSDEETGERVLISGCPFSQETAEALEWVRWHRRWQRGWMPCAGGLLDQSAQYLEVMDYLDELIARKEARDADERRTRLGAALP